MILVKLKKILLNLLLKMDLNLIGLLAELKRRKANKSAK